MIHHLPFDPSNWHRKNRPDPRLEPATVEAMQKSLIATAHLLRTSVALLGHKLTKEEREIVLQGLIGQAAKIERSAFKRQEIVNTNDACTLMAGFFDDDGVA